MSGGYFDYNHYMLEHIASSISNLIKINNSEKLDSAGYPVSCHYPPDIIAKFDETRKILRLAAAMVQRIDWLVSGDDGEDSFRERWNEEVEILR